MCFGLLVTLPRIPSELLHAPGVGGPPVFSPRQQQMAAFSVSLRQPRRTAVRPLTALTEDTGFFTGPELSALADAAVC